MAVAPFLRLWMGVNDAVWLNPSYVRMIGEEGSVNGMCLLLHNCLVAGPIVKFANVGVSDCELGAVNGEGRSHA